MKRIISLINRNLSAGKYISSGLLNTLAQTVSGFIILRWLDPNELGKWQSFTVIVGYLQILNLGTTSGLNRELPYWLGKGNADLGMKRLETAGYFTTLLSFSLMILVLLIGGILILTDNLSLNSAIMLIFAVSTGALSIQTNFLGATYRSAQSFDKLSNIQFINTFLYFLLIPLIYYFNIWGYIAYQVVLSFALYLGYQYFRPYKNTYKFEIDHFKELIKVGLPIYIWNYLATVSRSVPRLILVSFGSPLLVGLYSPAGSVNAAMLNLPAYMNRYLFPKMSYMFGQTNDIRHVYNYVIKSSIILFVTMLFGAILMAFLIPPIFKSFFPKYIDGILPAQITVFSGVFYSLNSLFHSALNSIKVFKAFKYVVSLRMIYILLFSTIFNYLLADLLLAVSIGAVLSEIFNLFNYLFFLNKAKNV